MFQKRITVLSALFLLIIVAGCRPAAEEPLSRPLLNAKPITIERSSSGSVPEAGLQTSSGHQSLYAAWPEQHRIILDGRVAILFSTPDSQTSLGGSAILIDLDSDSRVILDYSGDLDKELSYFENSRGRKRLVSILADSQTMAQIRDRIAENWPESPLW